MLRFHHIIIFADNVFVLRVTLTDAMRSMDIPTSRVSLFAYSYVSTSVLPAHVLVRFPFPFHVFLTLYCFGLTTHLLLWTYPVPAPFVLLTRLCLPLLLTLTCYSLSTHLPTRYSWTMTRLCLVSPFTCACTCIS